jgi:predicted nucleotidyltransferase
MQALEIAERFGWRIREFIPESRIYLFGSHARDEAHQCSDIDIGILVEHDPDRETALYYREKINNLASEYCDFLVEPHLVTMEDTTGFAYTIFETGIEVANPDLLV